MFNDFLDIVKELKWQIIEPVEAIQLVSKLFEEHPKLIEDFTIFLPIGCKIHVQENHLGIATEISAELLYPLIMRKMAEYECAITRETLIIVGQIFDMIPEDSDIFWKSDQIKHSHYSSHTISTLNKEYFVGLVCSFKTNSFAKMIEHKIRCRKLNEMLRIGDLQNKRESAVDVSDPSSYCYVLMSRLLLGKIIEINGEFIRIKPKYIILVKRTFPFYLGGNSYNITDSFKTAIGNLDENCFEFSHNKIDWTSGFGPEFRKYLLLISAFCSFGKADRKSTKEKFEANSILDESGRCLLENLSRLKYADENSIVHWKHKNTIKMLNRTPPQLLKTFENNPNLKLKMITTDTLESINAILSGKFATETCFEDYVRSNFVAELLSEILGFQMSKLIFCLEE